MEQNLEQARVLLEKAAELIEDGGWPGLALEVAAMADTLDAAAS